MSKQLKPFNYYIYKETDVPLIERTQENFSVIDWKNHFKHKLFEVDKLQSIILNDEEDFIFLKLQISKYNQDLIEAQKKGFKTVRNGAWRTNFIDEIFKMTLQLIYTSDREVQKELLKQLRAWTQDQLDRFDNTIDQTTRPQTANTLLRKYQESIKQDSQIQDIPSQIEQLENEQLEYQQDIKKRPETGHIMRKQEDIKQKERPETGHLSKQIKSDRPQFYTRPQTGNNILTQQLKTRPESNFQPPSEQINYELEDYISKKRTLHNTALPTIQRIKSYNRKQLIQEEQIEQEVQIQEKQQQLIIEKKESSDEEDQQIQLDDSDLEQIELVEGQDEALKIQEGDQPLNVENQQQQQVVEVKAPAKKKKKSKKKKKKLYTASMIPDQKPFTQDEYESLEDEQKMLYMDKLWKQNREKELNDNLLDQEIIDQKQKLCFEKMQMRQRSDMKYASKTIGNQFKKLQSTLKETSEIIYDDVKSLDEYEEDQDNQIIQQYEYIEVPEQKQKEKTIINKYNTTEMEQKVAKNKLMQIRKLNDPLINNHIQKQELPNIQQQTLSSLHQQKINTQRPFSAILQRNTLLDNQKNTQEEQKAIKLKLAEYKTVIDQKTLNKGLLVPEPMENYDEIRLARAQNLLINPFFKGKKKKKKRKGKKPKK